MTYNDAYQAACRKAIEDERDVGIMRNAFDVFSIIYLHDRKNRSGEELTCEVVTPAMAKAMRRKDGSFAGGGK